MGKVVAKGAKKFIKSFANKILLILLTSWVFWLIVLILILIFTLYYFISNPCDASELIGTWWANLFGAACTAVGN